ncbi:tryptophan transporter [Clostridium gasigenes]|uniref:Tryptophan transporter n=1 Tax=Clostridium gasigenes TaxID=94869 RepID=A0A7X0SE46_9CLOT|nr:tryptophan transporter [Clostridium gasigenes]MBB6715902.1 tryptophan transporter [Clostridium gasigenes]MBU3105571.1 tryptophan transporter [Clostridium gasigenes]MBU3109117.1 tryptophan transporter [Clostridium gasigenes]
MNKKMDIKKMTINSILIAIGAILHQITPTIGLPMQPDLALAMLFIIIILNNDYKTTLVSGIIIGVFTSLTTKFPGGQLPNIIDKVVTSNIIYFALLPLRNRFKDITKMAICLPIGTIISGLVFLLSAQFIVGLPSEFMALVKVVVIPAAIMNTIIGIILFKAVKVALKATKTTVKA